MNRGFAYFLRRKYHPSVFIALASLGILIGVCFSVTTMILMFSAKSWLAAAAILLVIVFWKRTMWLIPIVVFAGFLLGMQRAAPDLQAKAEWRQFLGQTVNVKGKIAEDVSLGKRGDQQLKLSQVTLKGRKMSGAVWLSTQSKLPLKRGFEANMKVTLQEGFGSFAASAYRAEVISVHDTHHDVAREVRDWFASAIRAVIPEPEASLGIGYLVGQRSSLPDNLEEWMRIVGLTHVVVASGYNLTILVRFARRAFAGVSKYLATLSSSVMIIGFILITGFSPSMSRAGLIAGLSLAAWYYGRKFHPLILLPFAAAITVLINPSYLWADLGWYLSFAAFGGVMILAPLLQDFFFSHKKPGTVRQILGETIAAQIMTMPIIAFSFGTISLFALPANLLVLPLVPLAMLLVFLSGVFSLIFGVFAPVVGVVAHWLLLYMTTIVQYIALLPGSQLEINIGIGGLVMIYVVIILLVALLWCKTKHNFLNDNLVE